MDTTRRLSMCECRDCMTERDRASAATRRLIDQMLTTPVTSVRRSGS